MDTNAPLGGASIVFEIDGRKVPVSAGKAPGIYRVAWTVPATGAVDISLDVEVGGRRDLVLLSRATPESGVPPTATASGYFHMPENPLRAFAGTGLMALVAIGLLLAQRPRAAVLGLILTIAAALAAPALGHSGHDHGTETAIQPEQRSTITVSKRLQFELGIRTIRVEPRTIPETVRLVGRVTPDPAGYARLQPTQSARVVADPNIAIPVPGQLVERGDTLLVLAPNLSTVERTEKNAALYKVESEISILSRQLSRWAQAPGVVPRKDVENARTQIEQLRKEKSQLTSTALGRMLVTAPITGHVTDIHVVPGETVNPDTTLVEIVNLSRLRVEAVLYDLTLVERIRSASASTRMLPGETFRLSLVGASPRVDDKDQGLHVLFSVTDTKRRLRLGMPLDVFAEIDTKRVAVVVPRQALIEHGDRTVLFVRTAPEIFAQRTVSPGRVIGAWAEIAAGLKAGERIVTDGVAQLRAAR